MARFNSDPDLIARRVAGRKRYLRDPANSAAVRDTQKRAARTRWSNPDYADRVRKIFLEKVQPKSVTPEALARRNHAAAALVQSDTKVPWCPREYRELHRKNVRWGHMTSAQSRAQIEALIAEAKRSMTFEEKLKLVAEGRLGIYTMPDLRTPDPEGTLGGVSAGWL